MPIQGGNAIGIQCSILALAGFSLFVSAVANLPVFLSHPKLKPITYLFGYQGARKVYAILGLTLIVFSVWVWLANAR